MGLHGLVDGRTFSAGALLLVCRRAWRVSWEGRPLCVVMEWPMSTGWERLSFHRRLLAAVKLHSPDVVRVDG